MREKELRVRMKYQMDTKCCWGLEQKKAREQPYSSIHANQQLLRLRAMRYVRRAIVIKWRRHA